jgi:hypothetical protein
MWRSRRGDIRTTSSARGQHCCYRRILRAGRVYHPTEIGVRLGSDFNFTIRTHATVMRTRADRQYETEGCESSLTPVRAIKR